MTTREELIRVLQAWTRQEMSEQAVWEWAQQAAQGPAADTLVRDVLDNLAGLPFDMIISDDAEVMLDALGNPPQETDLSVNLLWNHLDMISTDARRYELREHPFYGQFVDGVD